MPLPEHRPATADAPPQVRVEPTLSDLGFVVLDVETTGLSRRHHRILELALVSTDPSGRTQEEWATRFDPQGPVGATHIHGITREDVVGAPTFSMLVDEITRRLSGRAVVAHNAVFDLGFLRAEFGRVGRELPWMPALCTLEASRHYLPRLAQRRLADCCATAGIPLVAAHSALGDARATAALLAHFLAGGTGVPPLPEHLELPARAARAPQARQRPGAASAASDRRSSTPLHLPDTTPRSAEPVTGESALASRPHDPTPRSTELVTRFPDLMTRVPELLREVARQAILPRFGPAGIEAHEKSPGELVTAADRESEAMLTPALQALLPGSVVVGEEAVSENAAVLDLLDQDGDVWLLDPLDGTANFVLGQGPFALMVALLRHGEAVCSWLLDPLSDRLCAAEHGGGAWLDEVRVRTAPDVPPPACLGGSVLRGFLPAGLADHVDTVTDRFARVDIGSRCAGHYYPRVVAGADDFLLFWRTLPWDHIPGTLFATEAGAAVLRPDGSPYRAAEHRRPGLLVARNPGIWRQVRRTLLPGHLPV